MSFLATEINSPAALRVQELQTFGMEVNRLCTSVEQSINLYASDGIKRKLRENTTDAFQKLRYIYSDSFQEESKVDDKINQESFASENLDSHGSPKNNKLAGRLHALVSNPKFIDSVLEDSFN